MPIKFVTILYLVSLFLIVPNLGMAGSLATTPPPKETDSLWDAMETSPSSGKDSETKKLIGKKISVVGWIIPNEFESGELVSFLLARFPSGCIHVPLPPPSSVIHVVMSPKSKKLKNVSTTQKVMVEGILQSGGRVDASFEMEAESVKDAPL